MRKPGDRRDGTLLRDVDSMHFIMPIIYPNRCDNEAYISECIDLTGTEAYLAEKNAGNPEFRYTLFHIIVAAALKTIALRPKMNRFIVNFNTYQRNELSASFVVKKLFADDGEEALAFIRAEESDTLDTLHEKLYSQIASGRSQKKDSTTESMDMFKRMPRWLGKLLVKLVCTLDRHGLVPASFVSNDPYYSSVVLTNLGSLRLHSGYHHLTNWGTNSVFIAVGEKKRRPFFAEDGSMEMRESVDIGLTIDERLADGYYYSHTVRLLKTLIENPRLLEDELSKTVDY